MSSRLRLTTDPDQALEDFLLWVQDQGLTLYPHQESAIIELFAGNHVVLDAPTGSGKSLVAEALIWKTFVMGGRAVYTAPIKALVSEKFFQLCQLFGAGQVAMVTGDGVINRDAPIIACTQEILANLAVREGAAAGITAAVMDEFHYYGDRDRGVAWQLPLLTLPDTQFLLMSATLGDTAFLRDDLEQRSQRAVTEVTGAHRPVPLEFSYSGKPIHEALAELVHGGRAPAYVVHFTQNAAADQAQALMSTDFCSKEEKRAVADAISGFRFASPFGPTLRRFVAHGVGLHHAGLLPRYRLLVERLAQQGLLKVICGTDTLGVGINVPIRTVLFTQLCKFDGEKVEILKIRDFKQIGGRAGRAGFDKVGFVVAQAPEHIIENLRLEAKAGADEKKRKRIVKAQPPLKGYKHWDETTFRRLVESPPERLESRFTIDHGRLLMLMQAAQDRGEDARVGVAALDDLIRRSHTTDKEKDGLRSKALDLLKSLILAGVVVDDGETIRLATGLQGDFSLHHVLSLLLLDALDTLDPWAEDHTMRVLAWVEAILEQPRAVLLRQQDQARYSRLMELKAQGVPYEERQEQLEGIEWPKPFKDTIYDFFNQYLVTHPWLDGEAIRPKGVVAAMVVGFLSFTEFVRDMGLERSEGVLLRYLSEVWRALQQNVPERHKTEAVLDLIAWLRATITTVDSSLVTEWESMLAGKDGKASKVPGERGPLDPAADRRSFHARIRAELHTMVRALSRRDWEALATLPRAGAEGSWDALEWERVMAPFLEAEGDVTFDHRARLPGNTEIEQVAPRIWQVRQRLLVREEPRVDEHGFDDEDDEGGEAVVWLLTGRIDLRGDAPEGALIELLSVGP